ncbi:ABC transporter permease [Thermomonas alba]|uniref:ABC transporter permease n=1 Tax=Thermomonas alba TaxID=2888525 RepID=UPI001F04B362|nr:FtsX-like permease family protein [Thermomonas alba]
MEIRPILSTLARHKIAAALIVLEIALTCAILCNALFLVTQRLETMRMPSGLDEDRLLMAQVNGIGAQTDADVRTQEDLAALRAIPGVTAAVIVNQVPFRNGSWNTALGVRPNQPTPTLTAAQYMVGEGILEAMGLKLIAGRDFRADEFRTVTELNRSDDPKALASPVILSAQAARKLFPDGNALGKVAYMANIPLTVVGVVETLTRPTQMDGNRDSSILLPARMNFANGGFYLVRVADPARREEVAKAIERTLEKVDPNRLIKPVKSYAQQRSEYFAADRDMIGLLLVVSALLLLVTALGIVGLASFWVQQRTKQIGIRRALGATRGQILRYFQTENFLLASIGIVLGMLLAFAINQLLMSKYALPRLPWQYLPIGALMLWLLGQLAVLGPAWRAMAISPAIATRSA